MTSEIFGILVSSILLVVAYLILPTILNSKDSSYGKKTDKDKSGMPCLTFEQFLAFYELCPEKFRLYDEGVEVSTGTENRWHECQKDHFGFKTKRDLKRYQAYKEEKEKREHERRIEKESIQATERLIDLLHKEISKKAKEADAQINSALDKQEEILRRMMG